MFGKARLATFHRREASKERIVRVYHTIAEIAHDGCRSFTLTRSAEGRMLDWSDASPEADIAQTAVSRVSPMPSPFPGMDPYLERPSLWPDFHSTFIVAAREQLSPRLRPKYFVGIKERVFISDEADPGRHAIVPDVSVIQLPEHAVRMVVSEDGSSVEVAEPIVMQTLLDSEIHESHLEILDVESRKVVTVIEVMSPSNKIDGARGRQNYGEKRVEIMNSPCNLVEIDFLRGGLSFVPAAAWPKGDYFVHSSRAGNDRPKGVVWPIRLHQRLPVIKVPLTPGDCDVELDLQRVFSAAFNQAGYDSIVDFRCEPVPPLTAEQAIWADQLLKSKGLR